MKNSLHTPRQARAFTLIELLVVIAIIAILAGLILPAVIGVKAQAKRKLAKAEINMIASAIKDYEASYDRYPTTKVIESTVDGAGKAVDYTYGFGVSSMNASDGNSYTNSVIMQILLDIDQVGGPNENHKRNPKKTQFINAKPAIGEGPGVAADGTFRDAWGKPYVITFDMNDDGKCIDSFYSKNSDGAAVGLTRKNATDPWELNGPVMVWSYGPDGLADPNVAANLGVNKDNILSWSAR